MKKYFILLICLSVIIIYCSRSEAIDAKGKWSMGLNLGYYFPNVSGTYNYDDINLDNIEGNMNASNDITYGLNFNYRMTDYTFFQFLLEHYKGDLNFDFSAYDRESRKLLVFDSAESSDISIMPLSFDLGCSFLKGESYDLYALFGTSLFYSTTHIYKSSDLYNYSIKYPEENDTSIGFNVGAGGDYFFTKRLAANIDLRYYWGEADFNTEHNYDLGGFRSSIGLKIVLGAVE
jgi:hypothetical protein